MEALKESFKVLKMIIPILLIVLFLMLFLNSFIDEKTFTKHLGEESGIKGWLVAIGAGILSHGPGYIWYPLLQNLREKGVKDSLIIAFLYARSIKLPWLPMMISYFGIKFAIVFTLYIIFGAVVQGLIVEINQKKAKKDY